MKRYLSIVLTVFSLFSLSFTPAFDPDPKITISSPLEGDEFASGSTVNVSVKATCDCEMEKMKVIMFDVTDEELKNPLLFENQSLTSSVADGYSQTITLPTVTEETDFNIEVEVTQVGSTESESEEITITILP